MYNINMIHEPLKDLLTKQKFNSFVAMGWGKVILAVYKIKVLVMEYVRNIFYFKYKPYAMHFNGFIIGC